MWRSRRVSGDDREGRAVLGLLVDLPAPSGAGLRGSAWAGREFIPGSQSFDADLGREEEKQL